MKWLIAAVALAIVPTATAQDGCLEESPCSWVVDIDADGFQSLEAGGPYLNGTVGDWYRIEFLNLDEQDHTVRLDAYGLAWTVPAVDGLDTEAFLLSQTGQFALAHDFSGDTAAVNVFGNDAVDVEAGAPPDYRDPTRDGDQGAPGPATMLVLVAIALAALRRR